MLETPDTPPAAVDPAPASTTPPADPDTGDPPDDGSTNGEAARYRVRMREAETARDVLAGRLTAMQRRECEAIVAELLEVPADLWDIGGADPTTFYGDDDQLDADALRAAVDAITSRRPGLARQPRSDGPRQWGQHGGVPPAPPASSWANVLGK